MTIANDGKRATSSGCVYRGHEWPVWCEVLPTLTKWSGRFLENIVVRDMAGKAVAIKDKGEPSTRWKRATAAGRRMRCDWTTPSTTGRRRGRGPVPTDEGDMAVGNSVAWCPVVAMPGKTEVSFTLPPGWKANTPLAGSKRSFVAETRRELVSTACFWARAQRAFYAGRVELRW